MTAPHQPRYENVWSFRSLLAAFRRARRAKRGKGGEPAFYLDLEEQLLRLSASLRDRTYVPDPYRYFVLRNRKERVVSEASFRDRVVHHALVAELEPAFERVFAAHSYACRRGKGQHAAIERVHRLSRRHPYFLRLDVRRYFDSICHDVLERLLARRVEDDGVLWLCRRLLSHTRIPHLGSPVGLGLPIGNLTSQFWANVYLDPIDHLVNDGLGLGSWTRYMDDGVVLGPDKAGLWEVAGVVSRFVRERLGLELKARATVVGPVTEGIPWLGFRVFPGAVRLDHVGRRRIARRLATGVRRAASPEADLPRESSRIAGALGHARCGGTLGLRQSVLERVEG